MRSVLFVCTANRCRSPLAAALLRHLLEERADSSEWEVASAGTWAAEGLPATALAQAALAPKAIDLSRHRSRLLDAEMLQSATVILVMTRYQLEAIRAEFPEVASKTYLLSQLAGQTFDIEDPYDGTEEDYRRCASDIEYILTAGLERLKQLVEDPDRSDI